MSSSIGIAIVVLIGLIVAVVLRARAISNLKPVIVAAARKHKAEIHQSYLGMPQIIKSFHGRAIRLTPMNVSTSSPEGWGEMTCVDFDWPTLEVGDFRMREKPDARRNAVPGAFMGENKSFALGIPQVDERYSVVGTNREAVTRILTDVAVVESIIALPRGADIHVRGTTCHVTAKAFPGQVDFIDRLFATAERLLEAASGVRAK
jgi:hypothetical protein